MPANAGSLSDARLQDVRRLLENDYGKGAQATVIVRDSRGKIVMFISGGSPEEIEASVREYRSTQGS